MAPRQQPRLSVCAHVLEESGDRAVHLGTTSYTHEIGRIASQTQLLLVAVSNVVCASCLLSIFMRNVFLEYWVVLESLLPSSWTNLLDSEILRLNCSGRFYQANQLECLTRKMVINLWRTFSTNSELGIP